MEKKTQKKTLTSTSKTSPTKQQFLLEIQKLQDIFRLYMQYNCAFQLTSFGCKEVTLHGWNRQFRFQGHNYVTLSPPLMPPNDSEPTYLKMYFMDGTAADQAGRRSRDSLRTEILLDLQETLQTNHLYVRKQKAA